MNTVDDIGCHLHRTVKPEGHIGAPDIVIDGFWQADNVQPLLREQICGFMGAVSAHHDQTVKPHFAIALFHASDLIDRTVIDDAYFFKRLPRGAEDGSAKRQNAGKISFFHDLIIALDESGIAVTDAVDGNVILKFFIQRLCNAAHGCIQPLAIAAAGQKTDFFHKRSSLLIAI